ncbi:WD40 repeat domain-containing serine/threonine protein kinase [Streptomyces boninensis]|uniref:WD40 repeat domain-containing serine/threonine protein kinase n=1 Tax=Streptomyces boninensis TaxID=2039455 RepID=UPI003B2245D0
MAQAADTAPREWRAGDLVLDVYEVRDTIRSGGMGLVHRVLHRGWNVELAVKAPRPGLVGTGQGLLDFETEAATWAGLAEHPHTVSCVYVRRLDGVPRVFAEWLDGGSLAEAVHSGRLYEGGHRAALRRILDVGVQTAWGLEHAHRHGLIHQDVKPANVMLDRDGTAKVTDFGLAKARAAAGESSTAPPGASVLAGYGGMTPAYCSPEQADAAAWTADSGRPSPLLTRATDAWSWALTVLEMFTGYPPCQYGQAGAEVLAEFRSQGADEERDERIPGLPEGLGALLERCLAADPAQRPKDMGELAVGLAAIYAGATGEPYPRPGPQSAVRLADSLSNQALSMLDLGRGDEADALWQRAVEADPYNPHAAFNRGLHHWRTGRLTDSQVAADLDGVRAADPDSPDARGDYLLGLFHLERGDADGARTLLRTAAERVPGDREFAAALDRAEQAAGGGDTYTLTGHTAEVYGLAVSADRRTAVSAARDGTLRVWDLPGRACRQVIAATDGDIALYGLAIDGAATLAIAGPHEGDAQIWDLRTGQLLQVLDHGDDHVGWMSGFGPGQVAMSADGGLALTALAEGGRVQVWEPRTGRLLREFGNGPRGKGGSLLDGLGLSADGRLALARDRSADGTTGTLHVWDPHTGELLRALDTGFRDAELSADGRTAVTCAGNNVQVWDVATGRTTCTVDRPGGLGNYFTVTEDGRHAVGVDTNTTQLWETATGRCLRTWRQGGNCVASPDGRLVLTGDNAGTITVREVAPPGPPAPWSYPLPRPADARVRAQEAVRRALDHSALLLDEGFTKAAAEEVRRARALPGYRRHRELLQRWQEIGRRSRRAGLTDAWRRATPPMVGLEPHSVRDEETAILELHSGAGLFELTSTREGTRLRLLDLRDGSRRGYFEGDIDVQRDLTVTADDRLVLSAGADGVIRGWDVESGRCVRELKGRWGRVFRVKAAADGSVALSGGRKRTIRVWDLEHGAYLGALRGHRSAVSEFGISADGRYAYSYADDGPWLWDVPRRRRIAALGGGDWLGFALSGSGTALWSRHRDGTVRVWDVPTGSCLHTFTGHDPDRHLMDVGCSFDGTVGASVSDDRTLRVWDLHTGACRHVGGLGTAFPVYSVRGLAVSADGRFAVTGGQDGVLRVWDLDSGECLRTLDAHTSAVMWLTISADGHAVISRDRSGATRVWELDWDYDVPAGP